MDHCDALSNCHGSQPVDLLNDIVCFVVLFFFVENRASWLGWSSENTKNKENARQGMARHPLSPRAYFEKFRVVFKFE